MSRFIRTATVRQSVSVLMLIFSGCPKPTSPPAATSSPARAREMRATTYEVADGFDPDEQEVLDPDRAALRGMFEALDWDDADRRPHLRLEILRGGYMVVGRRASREGYYALWQGRDEGHAFLRVSPTLSTRDEVLALLLSFHGRDPELKSAIDWHDEWAEEEVGAVDPAAEL
jgi:hypothetical protein